MRDMVNNESKDIQTNIGNVEARTSCLVNTLSAVSLSVPVVPTNMTEHVLFIESSRANSSLRFGALICWAGNWLMQKMHRKKYRSFHALNIENTAERRGSGLSLSAF